MTKPTWPDGPYLLATSNSFRLFLDQEGRPVCVPTLSRSDGHPDLILAPGVGPLFETSPRLYRALERAERMLVKIGAALDEDVVMQLPTPLLMLWESIEEESRQVLAEARGENDG